MAGHVAGAMLARRGVFECAGVFDTRLKVGEFIEWYMRVTGPRSEERAAAPRGLT